MAWSLFPPDALNRIAKQQANLVRAIDNGWPLKFYPDKPVKRAGKTLSTFKELAGRLTAEARRQNGRINDDEYKAIAVELDNAGFKPLDHFEGKSRTELADWNKKHPRVAIHTFAKALAYSQHRRGVHRLLSRAKGEWEESHKNPQR